MKLAMEELVLYHKEKTITLKFIPGLMLWWRKVFTQQVWSSNAGSSRLKQDCFDFGLAAVITETPAA